MPERGDILRFRIIPGEAHVDLDTALDEKSKGAAINFTPHPSPLPQGARGIGDQVW